MRLKQVKVRIARIFCINKWFDPWMQRVFELHKQFKNIRKKLQSRC
jgi:hypothetical protein